MPVTIRNKSIKDGESGENVKRGSGEWKVTAWRGQSAVKNHTDIFKRMTRTTGHAAHHVSGRFAVL